MMKLCDFIFNVGGRTLEDGKWWHPTDEKKTKKSIPLGCAAFKKWYSDHLSNNFIRWAKIGTKKTWIFKNLNLNFF
jgi:hypothetical protein